jgi:hypothetical protein
MQENLMEDNLTILTSKLLQEKLMEDNLTLLTSKLLQENQSGITFRSPHITDI